VRAAARFLDEHPELFPDGQRPATTAMAVLAVAVHRLFLDGSAGSDGHGVVVPDIDDVRTALSRVSLP
jgi:hypothetical protein